MANKRRTLDEWKTELVGKTFGWLTVLDVITDPNDNKTKCVCKCKCGNIKLVYPCHIAKNKVISCGCFVKSNEFSNNRKQYYKDNPDVLIKRVKTRKQYYKDHPEAIEQLSINAKQWCKDNPDKVKDQAKKCRQYYIDHPEKRLEIGKHTSTWAKNNPDKIKEKAEKYSQWCKDNPDKLKERSDKFKQWCKDNPDKLKEAGKKVSQWYKDNPDKVLDKINKFKEWCKNNKEVLANKGKRYSNWCKDNPDKVRSRINKRLIMLKHNPNIQTTINNKRKLWYINNPDKVCNIGRKIANTYRRKRTYTDYTKLLEIIHPNYKEQLLEGKLDSTSQIMTKCPICGEYDYHTLHNVFKITYSDLKCDDGRLCSKCASKIAQSRPEKYIKEYIQTIYDGDCIENDRSVLNGKELDLYYPNKNIAIEFNGNYWHDENHKDKYYHFNKFKSCKEKGIRLISVFESDWLYKRDKILSILNNAFNNKRIIFARKCTIKQLEYKEKSEFINKYHFDGDSNQGSISYGLYYNNELVSVMSFGKLRGQNSLKDNNNYELVRFVNKDNISIISGATRLFNHFIKDYKPNYILCYSDNDLFSGDVYSKLGFTFKTYTTVDYQWIKGDKCLSRYECMPKKLLEKYDKYNNIKINWSVESFIMHDLGYNRVYRCGNSIWEYNK